MFLFSSSLKGIVVENLHVVANVSDTITLFGFWGHGEAKSLTTGGIFVGQNGVAIDSHFLCIDNKNFSFTEGNYVIEIFAKLFNGEGNAKIGSYVLMLEEDMLFQTHTHGVLFNFDPATSKYVPEKRAP